MKDNSKTDYVFGYMYDLWLFSVGAKLSDAGVLKADKLMFHTAEYKGETDFAFPICDSSGVFINITSALGEVGGTLFIRRAKNRNLHTLPRRGSIPMTARTFIMWTWTMSIRRQ